MNVKNFEKYSENEIVSLVREGHFNMYELVIRRLNPLLYKTGRSYGYNHHDTEDLMQETFISAYNNLHSFEGRSSFRTWVVRIMLNHCYQKKQKFSFKKEAMFENVKENSRPMFTNHDSTEKVVLNKELKQMLEKALDAIPLDYKMVFSLREMNGLNISETAEVLDISEANVKTRLSRAKTMLRNEIESLYSPEEIFEFNLVYCDRIVNRVLAELQKQEVG